MEWLIVRLVACQSCHAQLDVTRVSRDRVHCACGAAVHNRPPTPLDIPVHRCSACGGVLEEGASSCSFCGAGVVRDARRLGLVCPGCFARTVEGGRFCTGCGVAIRPQPVRDDGGGLACPVCDGALVAVDVADVTIHECRACGGSWVRNVDFDDIVERVQQRATGRASHGLATPRGASTVQTGTPVAYRPCPECWQLMHRRNFGRVSGVIVDWCRQHGTWLDASELEAVAAFVKTGGLEDRGVETRTSTTITTTDVRVNRTLREMDGTARARGPSLMHVLFDVLR